MDDTIVAYVQSVIEEGKHGPYAVATSEGIEGSITFSLLGDVWQENRRPKPGNQVVFSDLDKKRSGWRANQARFLKPADEQYSKTAKEKNMNVSIEQLKEKTELVIGICLKAETTLDSNTLRQYVDRCVDEITTPSTGTQVWGNTHFDKHTFQLGYGIAKEMGLLEKEEWLVARVGCLMLDFWVPNWVGMKENPSWAFGERLLPQQAERLVLRHFEDLVIEGIESTTIDPKQDFACATLNHELSNFTYFFQKIRAHLYPRTLKALWTKLVESTCEPTLYGLDEVAAFIEHHAQFETFDTFVVHELFGGPREGYRDSLEVLKNRLRSINGRWPQAPRDVRTKLAAQNPKKWGDGSEYATGMEKGIAYRIKMMDESCLSVEDSRRVIDKVNELFCS